jgi:hypothetical protein
MVRNTNYLGRRPTSHQCSSWCTSRPWDGLGQMDGDHPLDAGQLGPGPADDGAIEVMGLIDATRWMVATVRAASIGWDGSDPVRHLA